MSLATHIVGPPRRAAVLLASLLLAAWAGAAAATPLVVDFSDLTLDDDSFFNGGPDTNTGSWTSQGVLFGNRFTDWGGGFVSWNGFAYSNVDDTTTGDFTNQYAAITGTAFAGTIYAVGYSGSRAFIDLPAGMLPTSVRLTNTTYAARDMETGSSFSRAFGPGDFLTVTFTGYAEAAATGSATGATTFYLADFLDGNSLIVNTWELLDLAPLVAAGQPASIGLSWESNDVGQFGINTPTYVALDALTLAPVPEPGTWALAAGAAAAAAAAGWRRDRRRRLVTQAAARATQVPRA
jgi:hypothetical protein